MEKGINVLSLFDGMSCGQIALNKIGISINKYFASEIHKPSIYITNKNYNKTIHIGDVRNVSFKNGILYTEVGNYNVGRIDLLIGGSPCTNLSFSGNMQGLRGETLEEYLKLKEENFDFGQEQSFLFWEYVRLLKEINPKNFLLENVKMTKKWEEVINQTLEVKSIAINSSLFTAQNRPRLYWTNIPFDNNIIDKKLVINDILENVVDVKYFLSERGVVGNLKSKFLDRQPKSKWVKSGTLKIGGNRKNIVDDYEYWEKLDQYSKIDYEKLGARLLTPIECERLQTVPDNYTQGVSDTQRYKMLGNGWTVDVIAHLFKQL